jgi:hypothetical membrane protein
MALAVVVMGAGAFTEDWLFHTGVVVYGVAVALIVVARRRAGR